MDEQMDALVSWLVARLGLAPTLVASETVVGFIERRIGQLDLADAGGYLEHVRSAPDELERILAEIAVPETWFFRYPASFELLYQHLRALRSSSAEPQTLRMLSLACATGEEPYSMAMTAAAAGWDLRHVVIDAVDIGSQLVATARRGHFTPRSVRDTLPAWCAPWLTVRQDRLRMADAIRGAVRFHQAEADRFAPPESALPLATTYQVIFCRNLMIYLSATRRARLVRRLTDWLAADGLLFVGHAEVQIESLDGPFHAVDFPQAFAIRLSDDADSAVVGRAEPHAVGLRREAACRPAGGSEPSDSGSTARQVADGGPDVPSGKVVARLAAARQLADSGQLEEAYAMAESLLVAGGPGVALFELLGSLSLARERFAEAADWFGKVVYLDPNHEEALLQLAVISERRGQRRQSIRYRQRALRAHRSTQSDGEASW
ncbi:MAG: CheR family methyltransferase [Pirellulales bacterium]